MVTELSKTLKILRTEKKLTQQNVAEFLKISQQTYSNYENGTREPDVQTLIDLANFYRVSLDILMGRYPIKETNEINKKHCS